MRRVVWVLGGLGAVVALIGVGAAALTRPGVATPLARALIGGRSATLSSAWVTYTPWPAAHLRDVEIEGRGHAEEIDAAVNLFGVLPGVALLPSMSVERGALLLELGPDRASKPPGFLGEIVDVDLSEVRLDIQRPERDPQVLTITSANGNLGSGSFTLEGAGGAATLTVTGEAAALSLANFRGDIRVEGENFAELAALLGFAAPDTPAYALEGGLRRDGETWRFEDFDGTVGDSDLAGSLAVDFAGERPHVTADLRSRSLDFADLGVIVGAPSDAEDGEMNARQEEIEAQYAEDADRAIPNSELDFERIDAVDADIVFTAESVSAGGAPLEAMELRIRLQDSVLAFERIVFTAPQGRFEASGEIDARDPADVTGALAGSLEGFELGQIGGGRVLRGPLTAEFDLAFAGSRMRDAFATLDGKLAAWSTDAEIRGLAEEAAGLDLGEVLALMLSESEADPSFREARCLAAVATVEGGVARVDPAVLDTEQSVTRLQGTVDFRSEALDLEVTSDAKDLSWGSLFGGAGLGGVLRRPAVEAPVGAAVIQTGAAALLGGLTAGLAALPFIEPGLGEDAPCGRLLALAEGYAEEGEAAAE